MDVDQMFQVVVGHSKLMKKPGSWMMSTLVYKNSVNLDCFLERLPSLHRLTGLNASCNRLPRMICAARKEQKSLPSRARTLECCRVMVTLAE